MENQQEPQTSKKFYEKTWFVVLMLIFIAPVGLLLMWLKKPDWSKKLRLSSLFLLVDYFCLVCFLNPKIKNLLLTITLGK